MPRRFEEGRVSHVYNRFSRGEPIFEETVDVGRFLGLHVESVSRQSSRGRVKLAEDPEFAQRFEDLDRTLAEMAESESG
jgi:hypothetical protein